MFTGLIQSVGRVARREGLRLWVEGRGLRLRRGDSVAVNGVCLTVAALAGSARSRRLSFDVSEETLARTTLGTWRKDQPVNLETALRAGDPLGGHIVQGHVDGVGRVLDRRPAGGSTRVRFEVPAALTRALVSKGSIAIDGVSLTVVAPRGRRFDVALIPYTEQHTTLGLVRVGDRVNVEADVMIKYFMQHAARGRS
jgi:riboflavin synthase alpha subunit